MNKKIIIPAVIGALLIIFILFNCIGKSKIEIVHTPINANTNIPDSITLNVYVENSGSMDAYMCNGSNLKDAVYDYVSDLKKHLTQCNLYYINSQIIPCNVSLDNYIKNLTPQSFAKAGGNRGNTDLRDIFNKVMTRHSDNSVSVFVSDCILDIPQSALDYFGNCQVSMKNTFNEALTKYPNLGVEIIKLESKFQGYWFCGHKKELLQDAKRPYYIWVIGNKNILKELNKKVPVDSIIGGIEHYCAYSTAQPIPIGFDKIRYVVNHTGKINIEILADLSTSLQDELTIRSIDNYSMSNLSQLLLTSVLPIKADGSKYSHVLNLTVTNPKTINDVRVTFTYPYLPKWVGDSNDDTGTNVKDNMDKTTGILYLVKGVAEAYKEHTHFGSMEFKLKNK